jgi:dCMP deaminase
MRSDYSEFVQDGDRNPYPEKMGMIPDCDARPSWKDIMRLTRMNRRPSFEESYMLLAMIMSLRSTCSRRQVGCAITSSDYRRVLSVGYNGNAAGLQNQCDNPGESGGCGCIHAEENAVISCSEPRITEKVVFSTVYPCRACAKRLVQLGGVVQVYYLDDYHDDKAATVFQTVGIKVDHLDVHTDILFAFQK